MPTLRQLDSAPLIAFRQARFVAADGRVVLAGLDLAVARGELLVLLGRSGAGKTTALKLVNRLLEPSGGEVLVEGRSTLDQDPIALRRRIGYVIQESGLFPHYDVARNVGLVPALEGWPPPRVRARVAELLAMVGLPPEDFASRYPGQLSGGQRQRVGLARALAADPPILLMDEPFGALDPLTRSEVRRAFQTLQARLRKTVILVTHDLGEALGLGDRIALLEAGELRGAYAPREFLRAADPLAAAYLEAWRAGRAMEREA